MYTFFQNLNETGKKLFYFRGALGSDYRKKWFSYEFSSGPALKLMYYHGNHGDAESMLTIGFFFFTLYLSFYLPKSWYFKEKHVATWDNNREFYLLDEREYGFRFYDWAFVWSFHQKMNESSSKDPWWMRQYIHIDDLILGKRERLENKICNAKDVYFMIGDKEFKMDSITWKRNRDFRRYIPYFLYHKTWHSVEMKIKNPPMISGKGENSWDCGDDGTFGMYSGWDGSTPRWDNIEALSKEAVTYYVDSVFKDLKKYGGSDSERGIRKGMAFKYIGRKRSNGIVNIETGQLEQP